MNFTPVREVQMLSPLLFVYGTLRRGSRHPMARLLTSQARYLGAARVNGRLYRVAGYPGLILTQRAGEWVHGDLFAMRKPRQLLARLDRYEGLDRGRRRLAEYQRICAVVELEDGTARQAWLYRYRRPVQRLPRLISGDYLRQRRRAGQSPLPPSPPSSRASGRS